MTHGELLATLELLHRFHASEPDAELQTCSLPCSVSACWGSGGRATTGRIVATMGRVGLLVMQRSGEARAEPGALVLELGQEFSDGAAVALLPVPRRVQPATGVPIGEVIGDDGQLVAFVRREVDRSEVRRCELVCEPADLQPSSVVLEWREGAGTGALGERFYCVLASLAQCALEVGSTWEAGISVGGAPALTKRFRAVGGALMKRDLAEQICEWLTSHGVDGSSLRVVLREVR